MVVQRFYNELKYKYMKKFEHLTSTCAIEDVPEELNACGKQGWEFVNLVVMQSMVPPSRLVGGMGQPQMKTEFMLIFKREKITPEKN